MTVAAPTIFMRPKFSSVGERGKPLPLDVISDLGVFTHVVSDVAKSEFFRRNPKRKRIPPKFLNRFLIRLDYEKDQEENKCPILVRDPFEFVNINPHFEKFISSTQMEDEFSVSRDIVLDAVVCANRGAEIPKLAPISSIIKLKHMGTRLIGNSILLSGPVKNEEIAYSQSTRKSISQLTKTNSKELVEITGIICAVDLQKKMFNLLTSDGQVIPTKYRFEFEPIIRRVFENFIESRVCIKGIAKLNYLGSLISIDSIQTIEAMKDIQESPNLENRIAEIKLLQPGWLDGVGEIISEERCEFSFQVLKGLKDDFSIPYPFLYPVPDGNLQAEWTQASWDITLLFDFDKDTAEFFAIHSGTNSIRNVDIQYEDQRTLIDSIAQLFNALLFEAVQ